MLPYSSIRVSSWENTVKIAPRFYVGDQQVDGWFSHARIQSLPRPASPFNSAYRITWHFMDDVLVAKKCRGLIHRRLSNAGSIQTIAYD